MSRSDDETTKTEMSPDSDKSQNFFKRKHTPLSVDDDDGDTEQSSRQIQSLSWLWEWATHDDESYHDFSDEEATEIRSALLQWYDANRRKLPWRGDSPPYDGSTAGIGTDKERSSPRNKRAKTSKNYTNETSKEQSTLRSYFSSNTTKSSPVNDQTVIEMDDSDNNQGNASPNKVSAYGVWVSEIMLQQTRVEAVIPYYLKWMQRFPTVHDLAQASEDDVNSHWAGLGFYRRAKLLHKGAQYVVDSCDGVLPSKVEDLMKINGIGRIDTPHLQLHPLLTMNVSLL